MDNKTKSRLKNIIKYLIGISAITISISITVNICSNNKVDLENIHRRLNKSEYGFSSTKIPDNQMVDGRKGSYYFIDLYDMTCQVKKQLFFKEGEYTVDLFNEKYSKTLSEFVNVVDSILEFKNAEVFVLGKADLKGNQYWSRFQDQNKIYSGINMLKRLNNYRFLNSYEAYYFPQIIKNKDLPNLRSAYIQDKLRYYNCNVNILEGCITDRISEEDRNVVLLLYVKWD